MGVAGSVHYKRFQALSRQKIAKLLTLDEQAQHVIDHAGFENIRDGYRALGQSLTVETMQHYGKTAEDAGRNNVARQWYEELKNAGGDGQLLRTLLVRIGWRTEAEKHFGRLTVEEYRTIGLRLLEQRSFGTEHLTSAFYAFNSAEDKDGLRRVRQDAVKLGDHKMAERVALELDHPLTTHEHEKIGRALINDHIVLSREALYYVLGHKLNRLARECIKRLIKDGTPLRRLQKVARQLSVKLTQRDLETLFQTQQAKAITPDEVICTARALARRSKRWQKRLHKLYIWARDNHLGWGHVKQANRYGRLCGKPISVEEAMAVYVQRSNDSDQYLDWVREQRRDALELATERIAKAA